MADLNMIKAIAKNAYEFLNVSRDELDKMDVFDAIEKNGYAKAAFVNILRELGEEIEGGKDE